MTLEALLNITEPLNRTIRVPCSPRPTRLAVSIVSARLVQRSSARRRKNSPTGVSVTPRVGRTNSAYPIMPSICLIWRLRFGWATAELSFGTNPIRHYFYAIFMNFVRPFSSTSNSASERNPVLVEVRSITSITCSPAVVE
jgi:hypothetical protein